MNALPPFVPEDIERLVRAALDADAREVNLSALEQGIEDRLADARPSVIRLGRRRLLSYSAVAAACIVLLAALSNHLLLAPTTASAYSLVSTASSAMKLTRDRCYRIDEFRMPPSWSRTVPLLQGAELSTLWSRGDRFRVVSQRNGRTLIWGQDEQRRLWCAIDGKRALLYEEDELPERVREVVTYLNLDLGLLMSDLLSDYQLDTEPGGDNTVVVVARHKGKLSKAHQFNWVRLEIEKSTSLIRRMEMSRKFGNNEAARFSFVLIDEQPQPDQVYQLQHNIESDAEVFDRSRRGKRIGLYKGLLTN